MKEENQNTDIKNNEIKTDVNTNVKNNNLIIIALVAVILLLGGFIIWYLNKPGKNADPTTNTPEVTESNNDNQQNNEQESSNNTGNETNQTTNTDNTASNKDNSSSTVDTTININKEETIKEKIYMSYNSNSGPHEFRYTLVLSNVEDNNGFYILSEAGANESGEVTGSFKLNNNKIELSVGPYTEDNKLELEESIMKDMGATLSEKKGSYKTYTLDFDDNNLVIGNIKLERIDNTKKDINANQFVKNKLFISYGTTPGMHVFRYTLVLSQVEDNHGFYVLSETGSLEAGSISGSFKLNNNKIELSIGPYTEDNKLELEESIMKDMGATLSEKKNSYKTYTIDFNDESILVGNITLKRI